MLTLHRHAENLPFLIEGRIYAYIFQIIWQYNTDFHKTVWGISKSLFSYLITV